MLLGAGRLGRARDGVGDVEEPGPDLGRFVWAELLEGRGGGTEVGERRIDDLFRALASMALDVMARLAVRRLPSRSRR